MASNMDVFQPHFPVHTISSTSIVNDFYIVMDIAWMTTFHHLASCCSGRLTSKAASLYLQILRRKNWESQSLKWASCSFLVEFWQNHSRAPCAVHLHLLLRLDLPIVWSMISGTKWQLWSIKTDFVPSCWHLPDFKTCFKTVSFFRAKQVYLPEISLTKQKKVGVFFHLEYSCVSASAALRALARVGYSCLCVCVRLFMCLVMYLMMCLVVSLVVSFLASLYVSLYVLCFSSCSCSLSRHKKNICSPSHVISFIHCLWSIPDASRFGAVCNCQIDATCVMASIIARSSSSQFRRYQCTFYKKTWPNKIQIFLKFLQIRALLRIFQTFWRLQS